MDVSSQPPLPSWIHAENPAELLQLRPAAFAIRTNRLVTLTRQSHHTSRNRSHAAHSANLPDSLDLRPLSFPFAADEQISSPSYASVPKNNLTKMKCAFGTAGAMVAGDEGKNQPSCIRGFTVLKKLMLAALLGLTLSATYAQAGVRISFGIGIPLFVPFAPPPRPVYVAPAPVYVVPGPAPVYVRPAPAPVYVQPSPAPVYVPAPR
jgi:hypothetical protein